MDNALPIRARTTRSPTSGARVALIAISTMILLFVALPTLIVIPISLSGTEYLQFPPRDLTLRWYIQFFTDPEWIRATQLSLQIGLVVMVVSTIVGTMAAIGLVRGLRGGGVASVLINAPLIVPTIIYAIAILLFFSQFRINGSFLGFVLAHSALASPYVAIVVAAALYRSDLSQELAAQSLGASLPQAIWHVTLPSIRPSLATGAALAFLTSFDDATVSFFLANLTDKTLPRKMFENLQFFISPVLAAVATLLMLLVFVLIGAGQIAQIRSATRDLQEGAEIDRLRKEEAVGS